MCLSWTSEDFRILVGFVIPSKLIKIESGSLQEEEVKSAGGQNKAPGLHYIAVSRFN